MSNRERIINIIAAYDKQYETSYVSLLAQIEDITSRKSFPLHVTASVYLVSDDGRYVLQIWHKSLGMWLQPGGHIEADELPHMAAARECLEETGLRIDIGSMNTEVPNVVEIHRIPKNPMKNEPEHYHCDLCYSTCARGSVSINKAEVGGVAWVPLEQLRQPNATVIDCPPLN